MKPQGTKTTTQSIALFRETLQGSPFNMCVEVATPNLYAVSQRNCRQAPDTSMTDMGRRSGCSSSNDDVESPAPQRVELGVTLRRCQAISPATRFHCAYLPRS